MAAQMRTQEIKCFAATYRGKVQVAARFHYKSSLSRESLRASTGTRRSPAVGERQGSLSLRVSFLERNLADGVGALPHACGGSAPRGWIEPQWLGGRRSQGTRRVERREQLTCRGAWLLQLGLAASSTRSVCPSSGLPGDASPALRPLEIDFCLRAIDSVSIDLWSRPIRERPAGRDLTGG